MEDITFEKLDQLGFKKYNNLFTYRSFPAPLYGTYRIDYRTQQNSPNTYPTNCWYIYFMAGPDNLTLKYPKTIEEVANFYFGICDLKLV